MTTNTYNVLLFALASDAFIRKIDFLYYNKKNIYTSIKYI